MSFKEAVAAKYSEYAAASPQERKRRRVIDTANNPILPRLSLIWFIVMLVVTAGMVASDIVNWVRYGSGRGIPEVVANAGLTGLASCAFFSLILIPVCVVLMRKKLKNDQSKNEVGLREKYYFFMPYSVYITVCLGGVVIFTLMCLLT